MFKESLLQLIAEWRSDAEKILKNPQASVQDHSEALLLQACALRLEILVVNAPD